MRLKSKTKLITLLVSLLMIGAATINSTVAFLFTQDGPVVNQFNPSQVGTQVTEEITEDLVKTNVAIKNTGDTTAWIRAAVVVTWQDAAGNVYGQMPVVGTDYTIDYNVDPNKTDTTKWYKGSDGFYYWPVSVAVGDSTGILIKSCTPTQQSITVSTGSSQVTYYLTVEILGSGIQTFQGIATWDAAWDKATKSEAVTTE